MPKLVEAKSGSRSYPYSRPDGSYLLGETGVDRHM